MHIRTDRALIRAAANSTRYVVMEFEAPVAPPRGDRAPLNLAIVLDRSGSMGGDKIVLARQAAERALRLLRPQDHFALVVYDDRIDVVVESTPATPEAVRNAVRRLKEIDARGSTDLGGGWLRGCEQVARHLETNAIGRCLLLTDGLANVGITSHEELSRHAAELRQRGVVTTTFGVGADFDERLLQAMADEGAGHFYYIQDARQIADFLTSELGEVLEVVARDAALEVVTSPVARVEVLNAFRAEPRPAGLVCHLGDLVSGQEVRVIAAVTCPTGTLGEQVRLEARLQDREGALQQPEAHVAWTFASHEENDRQPRDRSVDRLVAELYLQRGRRDALELNRQGAYEKAEALLQSIARKIASYAQGDAELLRLADEISGERLVFAEAMSPLAMKARHFASHASLRERDISGKAKRRPRPDPQETR